MQAIPNAGTIANFLLIHSPPETGRAFADRSGSAFEQREALAVKCPLTIAAASPVPSPRTERIILSTLMPPRRIPPPEGRPNLCVTLYPLW